MKLELGLVTFFVALAQVLVAANPTLLRSRTPTKTSKSLSPQSSGAQQGQQQVKDQQQRRFEQEMALFRRLQAMTTEQIKNFQRKLSPTQRRQLVDRLKFLKQRQQQLAQRSQGNSATRQNMVLSGASKVRNPSGNSNSVSGRQGTTRANAAAMMARARAAAAAMARRLRQSQQRRGPKNPIDAIHKYQSYTKKAKGALSAGCTYPMSMESTLDSFLAFSSGGCSTGGAVCYMNGQSCVDVGMSIMCCPPGFSSGTLNMYGMMRQMQSFMAQFQ